MTTEETIADFENKLAECKSDEEKCNLIYRSNLLMIDFAIAKKYDQQLSEIAFKTKLDKHLLWAHRNHGRLQLIAGEHSEALKEFNKALEFAHKMHDLRAEAALHNDSGIIYSRTYFPADAIESYQNSLTLFAKIEDWEQHAFISQNLASAYIQIGLGQKALEIWLGLLDKNISKDHLYQNLARYHIEKKEFLKAQEFLNLNESIITETTYTIFKIDFHIARVNLCKEVKQFEAAITHLAMAKELWMEYNPIDQSMDLLGAEAELYMEMGEWQRAEHCFLNCLSLAEKTKVKQNVSFILERLKELFLKQGKRDEAFEYASQYIIIEKEIKAEQLSTMQKILEVKQKFALSQKEKEITEVKNKELEEKNIIIAEERDRSETLLLNILPSEVAEELKTKGTADAKLFNDVTVLFTDFVGFTNVSEQLSPQQLVDELHACFSAFDGIIQKHNIEKIKTVGDAYLAVCGLPLADEAHAENIIKAAIEIKDFMLNRRKELVTKTFEIRIGIHSGSVVAGIVGVKKFAYDIWGDTVNTAARMEQNSEAGKINISEATYELVKDQPAGQAGKFTCQYRGEIEAKNKGKLKMYFVN